MGLAEKAIAKGIIAQSIHIRFNNRNISTIDISNFGNNLTRFPFLLMIEQWQTENLLIEFLKERGHAIENKTELLTFSQESDSVVSEIRNPGRGTGFIKSRFLIGADGTNSYIRKQLNIPFPGKTHRTRLFITDCEAHTPLAKNEIFFSFTSEFTAGFFPLTENRYRVDGMIPKIQNKEDVKFDDVRDFFAANYSSGIELQNPQWFSVFRSHSRCAGSYRQRRCFLVGDAAHVHSPVGARGMNTGIQDSHNLAWKLAFFIRQNASDDLLDTYEEERRPLA
jgi:2-polyprenyl-6-methoxyphenol hydroxylase-like FAD-dependent oxidoreductase